MLSVFVSNLAFSIEQLRKYQVRFKGRGLELAIRSYYREHNKLPESLADLIPDYIETLPLDPYDNHPLRYSAEKQWIYSIGNDFKDDGKPLRYDAGKKIIYSIGDSKEPTFKIEIGDDE